jgi:hypothetical protein
MARRRRCCGVALPAVFDALRFDPFNTRGGLRSVGLLNRLRNYAYPMSQRSSARTGGRGEDQRRAPDPP